MVSECICEKRQPGQELCAHHGLCLSGRVCALAKWAQGIEEEKIHLKSQEVSNLSPGIDPGVQTPHQSANKGATAWEALGTVRKIKPAASLVMGSIRKKRHTETCRTLSKDDKGPGA